jgi:hypothetical protein
MPQRRSAAADSAVQTSSVNLVPMKNYNWHIAVLLH